MIMIIIIYKRVQTVSAVFMIVALTVMLPLTLAFMLTCIRCTERKLDC